MEPSLMDIQNNEHLHIIWHMAVYIPTDFTSKTTCLKPVYCEQLSILENEQIQVPQMWTIM